MEGPDREREAARAMIRFHRLSKRYGLSSMNMCFLFLADLLEGAPVSKSGIADRLGVTRAGVDKMIGKTEDLVTMEKLVTGRYRLHVTDKGKNLIYSIAEQIEEIRK